MNNFADTWPEMYNKVSREQKAQRIVKILEHYLKPQSLKNLSLLDMGCSTGILDSVFANKLKTVMGIDTDKIAVDFAQKKFKIKNLQFSVGNALQLEFPNEHFDIVICTHIYEHVDNSPRMFKEIYRVLKPGGICFLAAINKFWILEPHYRLPFLSFLPHKLAHIYMRIAKKGQEYDAIPKSYWHLKKETQNFELTDYTPKVLTHPSRFGYNDLPFLKKPLNYLIYPLTFLLPLFAPTFFWVLKKKFK